jgi:hypothetical protein
MIGFRGIHFLVTNRLGNSKIKVRIDYEDDDEDEDDTKDLRKGSTLRVATLPGRGIADLEFPCPMKPFDNPFRPLLLTRAATNSK